MAELVQRITIERDMITGGVHVKWGEDIMYCEALGMLEFAKMLLFEDYYENREEDRPE
mgnify:FL=1